jgi:VCBS repeat-containing protein
MKKGLLHFFTLLFLLGLSTSAVRAQVQVTFPSISGSAGQTVSVPISLSGVGTTTGFNSFSFDVASSSSAVVFVGGEKAGSIIPANWTFASRAVANGDANNRVAAFGSSGAKITGDGVLVVLRFRIDAIQPGVTVQLTDFKLQLGATTLAVAPATPSSGLNASSSPVAGDDSYSVNEGATLTVSAVNGVLANDTDADGDALTATIGTSPANGSVTLNSDGSFTYTHNGSETTADSFTYSVSDGSTTDTGTVTIAVSPVNDPPTF